MVAQLHTVAQLHSVQRTAYSLYFTHSASATCYLQLATTACLLDPTSNYILARLFFFQVRNDQRGRLDDFSCSRQKLNPVLVSVVLYYAFFQKWYLVLVRRNLIDHSIFRRCMSFLMLIWIMQVKSKRLLNFVGTLISISN